jgi:hypothetical protein
MRRLDVRLTVGDHVALYDDIRSVLQENSVVAIAASLTAHLRVDEAVVDSNGIAAVHDDAVSAAWPDLRVSIVMSEESVTLKTITPRRLFADLCRLDRADS